MRREFGRKGMQHKMQRNGTPHHTTSFSAHGTRLSHWDQYRMLCQSLLYWKGLGNRDVGPRKSSWCHLNLGWPSLLYLARYLLVGTHQVLFCALSLSHAHTHTPPSLPFPLQNCQCCNYYCHLLHLVVLVSSDRSAHVAFARIIERDA